MEKANEIKRFSCRTHPEEVVRKVSAGFNGVTLYCVECVMALEKIARKNLLNIEELLAQYLKHQSQSKDLSAKFGAIPDGVEEFLAKEQEIKAALASHIEGEKAKTNEVFDKLKQACNENIEKKRAETLKSLEDQLVLLDINFEVFAEKVKYCKQGSKDVDTLETLVNQINRFEGTKDLEKFLTLLKSSIEENEGFDGMRKEEITQKIQEGLREMCNTLSGVLTEKPTTNVNNAILFEEVLAKWNSSVQNVLKELNIKINNGISKLSVVGAKIDSLIIKQHADVRILSQWVAESGTNPGGFELLYRGSLHGWGGGAFHEKCDNKGPTVVVIEATTGERFGGFTPLNWTSNGGPYFPDEKGFLFSLDLKEKLPIIASQYAIYSGSGWGPCFGSTSDITIGGSPQNPNSCYSDTGVTYKQLSTGKYFTQDKFFIPKEIEVYAVKKN